MEWPELNSQRGTSFKEKCHNGGDQFFRFEFTIKYDSFSLPNHPEASSVYDAKSGDEINMQTPAPKRLSVSVVGVKWILRTNSWHPSTWHSPGDGSATHRYICWALPLRFMLCVTVWCLLRQTFTYELVEITCGPPSFAHRLSPLNKLPRQQPPEDQVQARKAHQSRRNVPEVLPQGKVPSLCEKRLEGSANPL